MSNANSPSLSDAARKVAAKAQAKRRGTELEQIEDICAADDRVRLLHVASGAGAPQAFALGLHVRSCVYGDQGPQFERVSVQAEFQLSSYPMSEPSVGLVSPCLLYLPAVRPLARGGDCFFSVPCLYRRFDSGFMTLPYLVHSLFGVLTADPVRLNSPEDAMNREAAVWFVDHKDALALPLEAPLADPAGTRVARPAERSSRFVLEPL
jgi:hypothetical protein